MMEEGKKTHTFKEEEQNLALESSMCEQNIMFGSIMDKLLKFSLRARMNHGQESCDGSQKWEMGNNIAGCIKHGKLLQLA